MRHRFALCYGRALLGLSAPLVTIEAHLSNGLPRFTIVGLPEAAINESKERVRSALINAGFDFPSDRITINLAPANLPKEGTRFDLAIAISILVASGQLGAEALDSFEFVGELALSGNLRTCSGILPIAYHCQQANHTLVLPALDIDTARLCSQARLLPADHLLTVCRYLSEKESASSATESPEHLEKNRLNEQNENRSLKQNTHATSSVSDQTSDEEESPCLLDPFANVIGQAHAKRALVIAAAGNHSLLMMGPPGTGKSLLASRLPYLLPRLNEDQAFSVASIYSTSNKTRALDDWSISPFRSPHHTASTVALIGGGSPPKPGEISLAHHGILFLDELPEFKRDVLESLREPMEAYEVHIARAAYHVCYPSHFQFVGAMNPCPCGNAGHPEHTCRCTKTQIDRYRHKLSQPFLDRIDMHLSVPWQSISLHQLLHKQVAETNSNGILPQQQVLQARAKQLRRKYLNAHLKDEALQHACQLTPKTQVWLDKQLQKLHFSLRNCHRLLRVARTIADLENTETITQTHLSEALLFRCRLFDEE